MLSRLELRMLIDNSGINIAIVTVYDCVGVMDTFRKSAGKCCS